jgi:hypothetical protein
VQQWGNQVTQKLDRCFRANNLLTYLVSDVTDQYGRVKSDHSIRRFFLKHQYFLDFLWAESFESTLDMEGRSAAGPAG